MKAIETHALQKVFPNGVEAVAGIDVAVDEGEVFAFLGPNGAGKTTTIRMLTTLLRPSGGRATVAGLDVVDQAQEVRRRIGVALQEVGLDKQSNGREVLELQARLHGMRGPGVARAASEMLDLVGLTKAADRRVATYSGGMQRRLDLASALIHGPSVLFLDEPTAGLDPASRASMWREVQRLSDTGITVFLTTQYLEEADRLADRVVIIDDGRIVAQGTPAELKASVGGDVVTVRLPEGMGPVAKEALADLPGLHEITVEPTAVTVYLTGGAAAIAAIVRALDRVGIEAGSVTLAAPTLDDVFLRATGSHLEGAEPQEVMV